MSSSRDSPPDQSGTRLDARIAELERENRELRQMLHNGYLLVNDPTNSFLAPLPWSRQVREQTGPIKGCMRRVRHPVAPDQKQNSMEGNDG